MSPSTSYHRTEGVVTRSRAKQFASGNAAIPPLKKRCFLCDQSPTERQNAMPAQKKVGEGKPRRPKSLPIMIETCPGTTNVLSNNANRPRRKSTLSEKSLSSTSYWHTEGVVTRSRAKQLAKGNAPTDRHNAILARKKVSEGKSRCLKNLVIVIEKCPTDRHNAISTRKKVGEGKSRCLKNLAIVIEKCPGILDLLSSKATWARGVSTIPEESGPADTFASVVEVMAYEISPMSPVSMESLRWVSDDEFE